ncbi:MAG: septum formation family protein, partial [Actinomycetota bacterium]|nr:septum formation family protein [Actinomycetota bacterium]
WAFDEELPAPASDSKQADPTALNASPGSLVDRIRTLSEEQAEHPHPASPTEIDRDLWTTPSPEWEARSESTSRRSLSASWIRPVIALVFFGVMGIGFLVGQFDGRESIEDVAVGDCFDIGERGEIYDVPMVDCSELHDAELFATVQIDGLGSTYPGYDPINEWVFAVCESRFPAYVGQPYRESPYWIETLVPTEDGWSEGDRIGMCTVVLVDEDLDVRKSLGSAKGWGERT